MPRSYSFDGGFPRSPSKESLPYGFKEEVQKRLTNLSTRRCVRSTFSHHRSIRSSTTSLILQRGGFAKRSFSTWSIKSSSRTLHSPPSRISSPVCSTLDEANFISRSHATQAIGYKSTPTGHWMSVWKRLRTIPISQSREMFALCSHARTRYAFPCATFLASGVIHNTTLGIEYHGCSLLRCVDRPFG